MCLYMLESVIGGGLSQEYDWLHLWLFMEEIHIWVLLANVVYTGSRSRDPSREHGL